VLAATLIQQQAESTPFTRDVSMTNSRPTETRPPIVRFTLTNESAQPQTIRGGPATGRFPVRPDSASESGTTLVVTLREHAETRGGCWGGYQTHLPTSTAYTLQPEESRSNELAVVNPDRTGDDDPPDTCWPRRTFEFTETNVPFRITVNDDS
jgi:hypothetical protein